MPTYEYKCLKCGHHFDAFQSMTAEPLKECPECHGAVQRVITGGTGLIFKGSGFYITDYKNKSSSANSSTEPQKTDATITPTESKKKADNTASK